mgnify:CR=1 FL=1
MRSLTTVLTVLIFAESPVTFKLPSIFIFPLVSIFPVESTVKAPESKPIVSNLGSTKFRSLRIVSPLSNTSNRIFCLLSNCI